MKRKQEIQARFKRRRNKRDQEIQARFIRRRNERDQEIKGEETSRQDDRDVAPRLRFAIKISISSKCTEIDGYTG